MLKVKKIVFDKFKSNKFYYNGRDKENEEDICSISKVNY